MIDDPAKKALAIARDATGKNNLPMDQKSRLKRARAMGFDTKKVYYHGTDQDIKQFDPVSPQGHFGVYISKDPMIADVYATKNQYNEPPTYGGNIMPLYAKKNAPIQTNQMAGYYKVNHPSELRSIHANFDPNEINNLDIMKSNGGMIDNPDKAIRRATMVAKGLAKEIGPLPTGYHPKPPHPASMIPGVHVTGMSDEHAAIPDGYTDGGVVNPDDRQKNFQQWFGNSHVVDETGKPKVVYHGTAADVSQFEEGHSGSGVSNGRSFYFTDEPATAASYSAKDREAERLSGLIDKAHNRVIDTMLDPAAHKVARDEARAAHQALHKRVDLMRSNAGPGEYGGEGGNIVPVHLSLRNPLIVDAQGRHHYDALGDNAPNPRKYKSDINQIVENAKARGHDGAIIKNIIDAGTMDAVDAAKRMGGNTTYVAFHPHQIKSAIGNQGTYNLNDNDITKARGGDVEPTDETGFDAWHGTPHAFAPEPGAPLGRFRSDKIGTGEGAQAYGHGMYVGAEGAARAYRQALSGDPTTNKGEKPNWQNRGSKSFAQLALAQSLDKKLSGDEAIKDAMQDLHRNAAFSERKDIKQSYHDAVNSLGEMLGKSWKINPGHLYHVRVRANPEYFLDWDKPLSEQHPHVQAALENLHGEKISPTSNLLHPSNKGEKIYYGTAVKHGKYAETNAAPTAESLKQAGIPGIRYLDANSRDPDTDQPTHNHVIFDPSIIDIKHRYARGGDVKPAGATTMPDDTVNRALQLTKQHAPVPAAVSLARNLMPGRR